MTLLVADTRGANQLPRLSEMAKRQDVPDDTHSLDSGCNSVDSSADIDRDIQQISTTGLQFEMEKHEDQPNSGVLCRFYCRQYPDYLRQMAWEKFVSKQKPDDNNGLEMMLEPQKRTWYVQKEQKVDKTPRSSYLPHIHKDRTDHIRKSNDGVYNMNDYVVDEFHSTGGQTSNYLNFTRRVPIRSAKKSTLNRSKTMDVRSEITVDDIGKLLDRFSVTRASTKVSPRSVHSSIPNSQTRQSLTLSTSTTKSSDTERSHESAYASKYAMPKRSTMPPRMLRQSGMHRRKTNVQQFHEHIRKLTQPRMLKKSEPLRSILSRSDKNDPRIERIPKWTQSEETESEDMLDPPPPTRVSKPFRTPPASLVSTVEPQPIVVNNIGRNTKERTDSALEDNMELNNGTIVVPAEEIIDQHNDVEDNVDIQGEINADATTTTALTSGINAVEILDTPNNDDSVTVGKNDQVQTVKTTTDIDVQSVTDTRSVSISIADEIHVVDDVHVTDTAEKTMDVMVEVPVSGADNGVVECEAEQYVSNDSDIKEGELSADIKEGELSPDVANDDAINIVNDMDNVINNSANNVVNDTQNGIKSFNNEDDNLVDNNDIENNYQENKPKDLDQLVNTVDDIEIVNEIDDDKLNMTDDNHNTADYNQINDEETQGENGVVVDDISNSDEMDIELANIMETETTEFDPNFLAPNQAVGFVDRIHTIQEGVDGDGKNIPAIRMTAATPLPPDYED